MVRSKTIKRKVVKKAYSNYSPADYALVGQTGDNLNPLKPSEMEEQYQEIILKVRDRVVEAYNRSEIEVPEEVFSAEPTPSSLLNALNDLKKKLTRNPLKSLYDLGLEGLIPSLLNSDPEILNNPLGLNCEGVSDAYLEDFTDEDDDSGDDSDESSSDGSSSNSSSDGSSTENFTITFVVDEAKGTMAEKTLTITKKDLPLTLPAPEILGPYLFKGWYKEESYSTKIQKNKLQTITSDITLYGFLDDSSSGDDDGGNSISGGKNGGLGSDNDDCSLVELEFLKIILIILIIVKILIRVLITTYNILRAASYIAFRAQLAWINPPALSDLISYIIQRLSAIIFQVVAMLLLKLWSLLNFDCVSKNTQEILAEINACLAGLSQLSKSVDSLALQLSGSGELLDTIRKAVSDLKDQIVNIYDDLKQQYSWKNIKQQFKESVDGMVEDYRELFTNPQLLYSEAVPQEIRDQILNTLKTVDSVKEQGLQTARDLENTWKNLTNKKTETAVKGSVSITT